MAGVLGSGAKLKKRNFAVPQAGLSAVAGQEQENKTIKQNNKSMLNFIFQFILLQVPMIEKGIVGTIVYSLIGMAMCALGFKVADWLIPGHISKQISDDKNVAAAIVVAAIIIGICIIIAAAISG
jgi:putative membrane protein